MKGLAVALHLVRASPAPTSRDKPRPYLKFSAKKSTNLMDKILILPATHKSDSDMVANLREDGGLSTGIEA